MSKGGCYLDISIFPTIFTQTITPLRNNTSKQRPSSKLLQQHLVDFRQALADILVTPVASLATLLAIAATLVTPIVLLVISFGLASTLDQYGNAPRITAFLSTDPTNDSRLSDVSERLLLRNDISLIELAPRAAALAELAAANGLENLLGELEDNPLPDALIITPLVSDITQLENLAAELESLPEIDLVQLDFEWIRRLQRFAELIGNMGFLLSSAALLGFFLVIGNVVRLSIQRSHDEIRVLKLIGAPDFFILRPLLYSGLLYGVAAAVLALMLQALVLSSFTSLVSAFLEEYDIVLSSEDAFGLGVGNGLLTLVACGLIGLLAAGASAYVEVRRLDPQ